jgi:hypothetical protein
MSESDIDPADELLIEGGRKSVEEGEWQGADDEKPANTEPERPDDREQSDPAEEQLDDEPVEHEPDLGLGSSAWTHP